MGTTEAMSISPNTLINSIASARRELDLYNLDLAQWRVKHGMSQELIWAYAHMGRLSAKLTEAYNEAFPLPTLTDEED
jgi:hypothetical protein